MIQLLTGKYRKHTAWLLFFVFYGNLAGTLYAGAQTFKALNINPVFEKNSAAPVSYWLPEIRTENPFKKVNDTLKDFQLSKVDQSLNDGNDFNPGFKGEKGNIGGPSQPEMSSFKSIGADNMVNLFTGDFSYNIPLFKVGDYPVNIFYSAGAGMDQEASWVGLGWNINPGTISRNMRGLPDDYNGQDSIVKEQAIKHDLTVGVNAAKDFEIVGIPGLSANAGFGIFYNNRRGLGLEAGVRGDYSVYKSIAIKNKDDKTLKPDTLSITNASITAGIDLNSQNGMSLNAGFKINKHDIENNIEKGLSTSIGFNTRRGLTDLSIEGEYKRYKLIEEGKDRRLSFGAVHETSIGFARSTYTPSIRMPLTTFNQYYGLKFGKEDKVFFKDWKISGYIQETRLDKDDRLQIKPAFGLMYSEKANNDRNAMLDFNRLNDGVYTLSKPMIDVPFYTYDVFNISGEGTGGSFRGYRGNMGYMRDAYTRSKTGSISISLDLGIKDILHGGVTLGGVYSPSFVKEWEHGNAMRQTARFNSTDSIYQAFYFKNPGEKAIIDSAYYAKMGGDQLIRTYLINTRTATPVLASGFQVFDSAKNIEKTIPVTAANSYRQERDKRMQLISCKTAFDAARIGLDTCMYSYTENKFKPGSCKTDTAYITRISRYNYKDPTFYRKAQHISEIDVLEPDGRQYVYGIAAYEIKQQEVTFNTENTPQSNGQLVNYAINVDNSVNNKKGRDGFFQRQTMNGYAHSFLLTGILSPDYMDVTGDGISDDDLGTAIKFNYSRVDKISYAGGNYWPKYKWRMPADSAKATYNEGLKADKRDDKALYTYGEKELWYLHSIESKNMVAAFFISNRNDGKPVRDDNGGIINGPGQKKLDSIKLYTKADYLKHGANAIPIKTVYLRYKYKACKNFNLNNNSADGRGKLVLDALWFSYRGNYSQVKNKYVFKYAETVHGINANPDYSSGETDRWGNYKPHTINPGGVSNSDYPYTIQPYNPQNTDTASAYASAWNLEKILLPGGAIINVDYEADDYAYVQNRRACQMTKIAGFGFTPTSVVTNELYRGFDDNRFVFFDVRDTIHNISELREKYLQDFKQLLLKLWVKMPKGNVGADPAYEPVIVYAGIKSYGITSNPKRFYVEMQKSRRGGSPIMETVIQFLKDQLPSRAYPGYEVNGDGALLQVVRAVFGLMDGLKKGVLGFENDLRATSKCRYVEPSMCFARLNNPYFKKVGGGHRVKKITINDNWDRMTGQFGSMYGQLYDYTTTGSLNGEKITISSGVASYEPGVGNEENPFREVLKYYETQFLGPTDYSNVELPVAETFFPSPMIGYSKVSVRSIHHNKDTTKYKSAIGFQQTEFYTTRDFPVISDFTDFDNESRHHHKPNVLEKIFNFNKRDYITLTQGFRVVLNDMNGKLKSQTSYAENDSITPVNYTANYYRVVSKGNNKYKLDNLLPVISGPDGKISNKLVGKDVEVMNDSREHFSYTYSGNIPINLEYFQIGPAPIFIPTIFRMIFRDESLYRSSTTLKVVNEYGILDSIVNIDKGSVLSTKNMVYDAETGEVLISRTNNEFNKPIYKFFYPAWWVHSGMEPAYRNIDLTYTGVLFRNGKIEESPQVNMEHFESGDEIYIDFKPGPGPSESNGCIAAGYPSRLTPTSEYRIWAVDIRKDLRNTKKEFLFIDRYGVPCNAVNATIRVIRSGKRNFADASVGSIESLANPVRIVDDQLRVVIDSNTNIINASAAEFKERWRANDMFYAKDTAIITRVKVPIQTTTISAIDPNGSYSIGYYKPKKHGRKKEHFPNPEYFMARQFDGGNNSPDALQKSFLRFNFDGIPQGSTIVSAKLELWAHRHYHDMTVDGDHAAGWHGEGDPHQSNLRPNDFLLHRVLSSTWPSDHSTSWDVLFDAQQAGIENEYFALGSPPMMPAKDYVYNYQTNTDSRLNITSIVRAMVRDKYNAKNYVPALKISMAASGTREARICFWSKYVGGSKQNYSPKIEIKYYNCPDTIYDTRMSGSGKLSGPGNNSKVGITPTDSAYCTTVQVIKGCFSVFSKKQMNPYVEGVLVPCRQWKTYVYYGERRETDATASTDTRKDGIIRNFETYWEFVSDLKQKLARTNSVKWVWNSEITQYNRKGAELENRDPLGRYNMGIYGYQESLPVAVTNNSRLRLSAFDGFEDYFYKDDPCEPYCKPSHRHFTTGLSTTMLVDSQAHTGRYSVRIDSNDVYNINVNVSDIDDVTDPDIRIKMDTTAAVDIISVTPNGIGLQADFFNNTSFSGTPVYSTEPMYPYLYMKHSDVFGCSKTTNVPKGHGIQCKDMTVRFWGSIQVITTGLYEFSALNVDDVLNVLIDTIPDDGVDNYINFCYTIRQNGNYTETKTPVRLRAGLLYKIKVEYLQLGREGYTNLGWKTPGSSVFVHIPEKHLYPAGREDLADHTTETDTVYCIKPDTIQAVKHHLIDSFKLVPGTRMVASVWVKKGGQDCKCTGYNDVNMHVKNGSTIIGTFAPKERIIEGWQQFETIFTVPESTSLVKLEFNGPLHALLYIDDLRLHPFNANMRSFVYDPVTLWLTAELDENNYASFYEYDDDGGLIRVKKETRQGIKTIRETRSGIQKNIKSLD